MDIRDLGTQILPDWIWGELVFRSQNNTLDETNDINNVVLCYKEAVQFSASFVTSLLVSFGSNLGNSIDFCVFIPVTLIKIANTPLDRSAVLVLSVNVLQLHWQPASLVTRDLAGAGLGQSSKKWPDSRFAGARAEIGTTLLEKKKYASLLYASSMDKIDILLHQ